MKARPLSPHMQIYRPQLTSVMSIMHRITGMLLLVFATLWIWWLAALASGPEAYAEFAAFTAHGIARILLIAISWALFYHLLNGIRHLFWDAGWLLNLRGAYASGWTVLVLSVVSTALVWGVLL